VTGGFDHSPDKTPAPRAPKGDRGLSQARTLALQSITEGADRFALSMRAHLDDATASGARSYHDIARHLNRRGVSSRRGGKWGAAQVRNVVLRLRQLGMDATK
jgi:hypothetical protein